MHLTLTVFFNWVGNIDNKAVSMFGSTTFLPSTNFIFCRISLARPCVGLPRIRLKPTSNEFCLCGSVCSFTVNTLTAFMQQLSNKYKNAIVIHFCDLFLNK